MADSTRETRRGGTQTIGQVMKSVLRDSGLGEALRRARIYDAWRRAVGPKLARHLRIVRFRGGELTVEVDSAAHLHELRNFTGERYRRIANDNLGAARIRRVRFQPKR